MIFNTPPAPATSTLPGWFGKLPGMGDFASRRVPGQFRDRWDQWLQSGLHGLRARHDNWIDQYLQGPVWYFALGTGVAGAMPMVGVMIPSVDSAGRYFPLTLVLEWDQAAEHVSGADARELGLTWYRCAQVAMAGLEQDMDATRFENYLAHVFAQAPTDDEAHPAQMINLPGPGRSCWMQNYLQGQAGDISVRGLPDAAGFDALFGCGAQTQTAPCGVLYE